MHTSTCDPGLLRASLQDWVNPANETRTETRVQWGGARWAPQHSQASTDPAAEAQGPDHSNYAQRTGGWDLWLLISRWEKISRPSVHLFALAHHTSLNPPSPPDTLTGQFLSGLESLTKNARPTLKLLLLQQFSAGPRGSSRSTKLMLSRHR